MAYEIVAQELRSETRIHMQGDLAVDCRKAVDDVIGPHLNGPKPLVLDLREATFIDSSILLMLLVARPERLGKPVKLVVREGSEVERVLEILRFGELIPLELVS